MMQRCLRCGIDVATSGTVCRDCQAVDPAFCRELRTMAALVLAQEKLQHSLLEGMSYVARTGERERDRLRQIERTRIRKPRNYS